MFKSASTCTRQSVIFYVGSAGIGGQYLAQIGCRRKYSFVVHNHYIVGVIYIDSQLHCLVID